MRTIFKLPAIPSSLLAVALALFGLTSGSLRAADATWNNMSGSSLWNLTDLNWSTGAWNNANGYTLNGTGPLTFVNGTTTKAQSGNGVTASNFREDVDGAVNASDVGLVKSKSGTALP